MSVHFLHRGGRRFTLGEETFSSSLSIPATASIGQPATTSLQMWLRTNSLTCSNGDVVNVWKDVDTGNSFSGALGTVTNKFITNQFNGYAAIGFGTGGNMKLTNALYSNYTASQGCEIFMVCKIQNPTANGFYHNLGGDTTVNNNLDYPAGNGIRDAFGVSAAAGFSLSSLDSKVSVGHIMNTRAKTGLYEFLYNSSSAYSGSNFTGSMTNPVNGSGNAAALFSGCRGTGAALDVLGCSGSLFEILFYNAVLSDTDRTTTYNYLRAKYGL